ncbi:ABC-three component system middle component 8 [Aeromicrobium alkaliterrae]|uniref:Uncharacterized protein n=1 Tax=Aeromicrobium alkaliterrae TaxID=302168 RepID=A0ABP4WHX2_9ACTN
MLLPSKHSHPDATVLAAATVALVALKKKRVLPYDELKGAVEKKTRSADYLFSPALSLLYILGLVEYRPAVDAFEYLGGTS